LRILGVQPASLSSLGIDAHSEQISDLSKARTNNK
jgi:hypothetical protein